MNSDNCVNGHEYTEENTYTSPNGARNCRICRRIRSKAAADKRLFGGLREITIQRDGEKCVSCGITRADHLILFGVDITVDHIDGNGCYTDPTQKNNSLDNLQTLCQRCHGKKDGRRNAGTVFKLTDEDADDIRMFFNAGIRPPKIRKAYQMVCYQTIIDVIQLHSHKPQRVLTR